VRAEGWRFEFRCLGQRGAPEALNRASSAAPEHIPVNQTRELLETLLKASARIGTFLLVEVNGRTVFARVLTLVWEEPKASCLRCDQFSANRQVGAGTGTLETCRSLGKERCSLIKGQQQREVPRVLC